jgi:hypothetical protein
VKASQDVQNILTAYNATGLYEVLAEKTGSKFEDPDDVQSLYSTLKAEVTTKMNYSLAISLHQTATINNFVSFYSSITHSFHILLILYLPKKDDLY